MEGSEPAEAGLVECREFIEEAFEEYKFKGLLLGERHQEVPSDVGPEGVKSLGTSSDFSTAPNLSQSESLFLNLCLYAR